MKSLTLLLLLTALATAQAIKCIAGYEVYRGKVGLKIETGCVACVSYEFKHGTDNGRWFHCEKVAMPCRKEREAEKLVEAGLSTSGVTVAGPVSCCDDADNCHSALAACAIAKPTWSGGYSGPPQLSAGRPDSVGYCIVGKESSANTTIKYDKKTRCDFCLVASGKVMATGAFENHFMCAYTKKNFVYSCFTKTQVEAAVEKEQPAGSKGFAALSVTCCNGTEYCNRDWGCQGLSRTPAGSSQAADPPLQGLPHYPQYSNYQPGPGGSSGNQTTYSAGATAASLLLITVSAAAVTAFLLR